MRRNELKWILILIGVAVIILVGIVLWKQNGKEEQQGENKNIVNQQQVDNNEKYTQKLNDGTKINVGEEFNKNKQYKGLEIGNIQYTQKNGVTVLLADVKNTTDKKHEKEVVKLTIIGENGEIITDTLAVIGEIEPGKTYQLNASITADVVNAKDFKIEEK